MRCNFGGPKAIALTVMKSIQSTTFALINVCYYLQWDEGQTNTPAIEFLVDPDPLQEVQDQFHSLSLNAIGSASAAGTMRFLGILKGHEVHVQVNGGSDDIIT